MSAGLVGDQIRTHAARHQFRQNIRRVAAQGNRHGFAFSGVLFDARQRVIEVVGLFINIAGTQTEIDAALLALNVQEHAPASVAASGCAPPMPPSPAVSTQRPFSDPL